MMDEKHSSDRGRGRPPPGLVGREIGMWYAQRSKAKKADMEKKNVRSQQVIYLL